MNSFWHWLKDMPWATVGRRETHEELFEKLKLQKSIAAGLESPPLFSFVIALEADAATSGDSDQRRDEEHFSRFIASLRAQTYDHWEAIFVVSGPKPSFKILALHDADHNPGTFRWVEMPAETTVAQLKNEGFRRAQGDWSLVADAKSVLHPSALYFFATEIIQRPGADVIYCNEIELSSSGKQIESFIGKPELSWIDALHFPYLGRLVAVKKEGVEFSDVESGHFDSQYPAFHEEDRWFRLMERERKFRALPYYLYYRRGPAEWSAAMQAEWPRVVEKHLYRKGFPAIVESHPSPSAGGRGAIKVTPVLSRGSDRLVSVIICFKDQANLTLRAIKSLAARKAGVPVEFILVNNGSQPDQVEALKAGLSEISIVSRWVDYPHGFNFARMNNQAIREHARGEFLFLLNNDVFWNCDASIDQLVAWAAQPSIGTVGIRLNYPNGGLQHSGLVATYGGEARMVRVGNNQSQDRFTMETREVFANSFAACLFRRQVFERVGGLRELQYANGFGDVVFAFECLRLGLKHINLGHVVADHVESSSRGAQYEYWEEVALEQEFPEILAKMLRQDLGENRIPGNDVALGKSLKAKISQELTTKAPRLKKGLKHTWGLFSRLTQ